ncbi:MAG: hypothetical protein KDJ65_23590 [Anaerolineae bacterium]|nr:hypothetical protein [Anaerolineae bacterium]
MTHTIHRTEIDKMIVEVTHLSANLASKIINEIHREQPALLDYLRYLANNSPVSNDSSLFSQTEYRYVYRMSIVLLKMLIDSPYWLEEVSWDDLNNTITISQPVADAVFSDPTNLANTVKRLAETHPEPELLLFLSDACHKRLDNKPNEPPVRARYRTTTFLIFYTILTSVLNTRPVEKSYSN